MDTTPNLKLPYIMAAQAQKHVTHNEAIRELDAIVQLAVQDRTRTEPPAEPWNGARHIVASPASGNWTAKENQIAAFQDGAWMFYAPSEGWVAWVADEDTLVAWDGADWVTASGGSVNPAALVGVNATADTTNKLSVKSDATLFSHDDVTPGSGDMRQVLNKAAAGNTVSQLYQSGFSGRAETGLTGDDDFHLKVSADGLAWNEAMITDRATGAARFPAGLEHAVSRARIASFVPLDGGDGVSSIVRFDRARNPDPRQAVLSAVSGDTLTLTTNDADLIFHPFMRNVSYLRIWNISKATVQPAWVKWDLAANQLQVTDASHVADWLAGETVQLGDPPAAPGMPVGFIRGYALDVSPMLQATMGAVFPQKGLMFKCTLFGVGARVGVSATPNGLSGSYVGGNSLSDGQPNITMHTVPTSVLSPISNSNLVFVREDGGPGALSIGTLVVVGVWV